jgi:hypothetical protein
MRIAAIDAASVLGGELGAIAPTVRQDMHSVELFELIVGMFLAVLALQYAALRLRLPPAVALLVGGGALAFVPGLPYPSGEGRRSGCCFALDGWLT